MNSNLQDGSIAHMCPFDHCSSEDEVYKSFADFVAHALIPTKPPKYSRGRWTHFEEATMFNGLLAAHHDLLSRVISQYCGKSKSKIKKEATTVEQIVLHDGNGDENDTWNAVVLEMLANEVGSSSRPAPIETQQQEEHEMKREEHEQPRTGFDWVEYNRKQKADAAQWASNDPYPNIAIIQQVTRHLQKLMHHFLKISGADWEEEQEQKALRGQSRDYRILDCAKGLSMKDCFDSLMKCLEACPTALPLLSHTREFRVLFFCMISKAMCAMHQLLRCPQSSLPYSMFQALISESGWADFQQVPSCMRDELSTKLAQIIERDGSTREATAILESVAIASCVDVAAIECRHASNRDFSLLRSRGWTPSLQVISAKHACGTFKFKGRKKNVRKQEKTARKKKFFT